MVRYPCTNCGEEADSVNGCASCGRTPRQEIAALGLMITQMQVRFKDFTDERILMGKRLQGAITRRTLLQNEIDEAPRHGVTGAVRRATKSGLPGPARTPLKTYVKGAPATGAPNQAASGGGNNRRDAAPPMQRRSDGGDATPPTQPPAPPPGHPEHPDHPAHHPPETSTKVGQNVLLGLGALLFAVAAVVLTGYLLPVIGGGGRALIYLLLTALTLAAPQLFARWKLTATAETIASVAIVFVLLDGYNAWSAGWIAGSGLTKAAYTGLVCLAAAGIAAVYRTRTHLAAPKFAAVLLVQPVMPLLGFAVIKGISAWATVFSAVAAADLALALVLTGLRKHGPGLVAWALAGPRQTQLTRHTPRLIEAVWVLHALGVLVGMVCSVVALGKADTPTEVLGGAAALLIAAVVGMGGGLLLRRAPLPDLGVALATLAVIGAFGRVAAVVAPGRGLLCTALAVLGAGWALYLLGVLAPERTPPLEVAPVEAVDAPTGPRAFAQELIGGPFFGRRPGVPAPVAQGRRGAEWAGLLAVGTVGLLVLLRGLDAILAPVRASLPVWHADLSGYQATLANATHGHGIELCLAAAVLAACAVMFPAADRGDVVTAFGGLAVLLAPAAFGLPWSAAPVLETVAALAAGGYALAATRPRSAWIRGGTALVVGSAAAGTALAHPGAGALELVVLALGGAVLGSIPRLASPVALAPTLFQPAGVVPAAGSGGPSRTEAASRARMVAGDLALGGAAFALPGAIASATAALAPPGSGPRPILAATFLAVAGTLCAAVLSQVAWDRRLDTSGDTGTAPGSPGKLIALGTTLGAAVLAIVALRTPVGLIDRAVAVLLLVAGLTLLIAPWVLGDAAPAEPTGTAKRGKAGAVLGRLRAADLSAVVVTTATIAAVTRVGALIVPKYALVSAALVVFAVAAGIRAIPLSWRRGPVIGAGAVATIVGLIAAVTAVRAGLAVVNAARPIWGTDLHNWSATVTTSYAGQVPLTLIVLAVAAAIGLPRPWSQQGIAAGLGLAALAAPATLGLAWWSPIMLSGLAATIFGISSGTTRDPRVAWTRFGVAAVLFADTVAASLVAPDTTVSTLFAAAAINGAVAGTALLTKRRIDVVKVPPAHLTLIGGGALCTAVLTVPAAFACLMGSRHSGQTMLLTAALAGLCIAFAIAALTCYDDPGFLLYVTVAVAVGGTVIAVATLQVKYLPVEVYAAAAALLVVLSELLRAAVTARRAERAQYRPRASDLRDGVVARVPSRPGYTVGFAAGPATVLAVVWLAPRVLAALFGPYTQITNVWPANPPVTAKDGLGHLAHWAGNGNSVVAALLLTIAAALGAIGFGGSDRQIGERAVAVVIPGAAITLLIAPAALGLGWAAEPLGALLVAAICGLGVALTRPPAQLGSPLRDARRIIVLICILAAAAGLSGALATRAMTLTSLAVTAACGLVVGLRGHGRSTRITGWLITGVAGHLAALVLGRIANLPVYQSAFLVALVAAILLVLAATLPSLSQPGRASESITVEASAYAGAFFALLLASRSQPYLATFCTAWGVVLAIAATRPRRSPFYRRALIWLAVGHELAAWWLYLHLSGVHLLEAYSLAVAVAALVIGWLETRHRPDLPSWAAYGVALIAAYLPSLTLVLTGGDSNPWRRVLLILGAAGAVVFGALRRQQAPIVIGSVALVLAAVYELAVFSTLALLGAVLGLVALVMVALGAGTEQRRRRSEQIRDVWGKLR